MLILVSLLGHYIEAVADRDFYREADRNAWKETVAIKTDETGRDRPAMGFVRTIEICGQVLAEHFPP